MALYGSMTVGSWVEIREGCPMRFEIGGSGVVHVLCGSEPRDSFHLALDSEALREFLRLGTDTLREMDALYAREQEPNR